MSATAATKQYGGSRLGGLIYNGTSAPTVDNDASNGFHVGDRWIDTTNLRVYDCVSETTGAAVWLSKYLFTQVAASAAIANTTTETAFDKSYTVPAGLLHAGDKLKIRGQVIATNTNSTDTLNIKVKIGSTTIVASGALNVTDNDIAYFDIEITIRTDGASGTLVADGIVTIGVEGTATLKPFKLASTAIDTTATQAITVTATWSVADPGDSCRLDNLTVQRA